MAAIDSLLRLLTSQNADSLGLATDQVPKLTRAGAARPLSMPAGSAAMMDVFVGEVLDPGQQAAAAQADVTVDYDEFVVTVRARAGGGWAMGIKRRPATRQRERPPL